MKTKIEKINEDTWVIGYVERTAGNERKNKLAEVKKSDVDFMLEIIKEIYKGLPPAYYISYTAVVSNLIYEKKLWEKENVKIETMLMAFNGGLNRAKYYFPLYYYPLLVLEHEGLIERKGRGKLRLLDNKLTRW